MYLIDQNSKIPLHIQLYNALKQDIIENLKVHEKLPSIRKVAFFYNLSKNTVENAYTQLVAEGYIESIPKSGYVVSDTNYENFKALNTQEIAYENKKDEYLYDFFPARLSKDSFPLKLWKRLFSKAVDESLDFGAYPDGQGEFGLRVQIAKYITESRSVNCNVNQIVICNGFADSMGLLAKIIQKKYNTLAIEHPGYYMASKVFESYNYQIEKIPLNKNGLEIEKLKESKANIVYVTPSHQYPTGVSMPISNRLKLLSWANETDSLIIEDDYDSELTYVTRPIPSLQGLDGFDKVVYLGTFSKSLSPAIRVSYMVLPTHLLPLYEKLFDYNVAKVSLMTQKTLELFLSDGHWDRHLRKIRTLNRKKHNLMKELLVKNLGSTMKIVTQGGGLAILINPTVPFDFEKLIKEAKKEKLKIYFAKDKSGGEWEAIRMGFGGFVEEEIKPAVELFSQIWHKAILK